MGEARHVKLREEKTLLLRHLPCCQYPHKYQRFDDNDDDDDDMVEKIHIFLFSVTFLSQVAITCVVWSLYVLIDR